VERISAIVGAERLSTSAPGLHSSARARGTLLAPGSVGPWSSLPNLVKGKAFAGGVAVVGVLGAIGGLLMLRKPWIEEGMPNAVPVLVHQVPHASDVDAATHFADPASVPERLMPLPAEFDVGSLPSVAERMAPTPPNIAARLPASTASRPTATPTPTQGGEGFLKINSIPPSTCFLDGRQLGSTPITNVSVTPGTHVVTFVDFAQQHTKTVSVTVDAGETKLAVATLDVPAAPVPEAADGSTPPATPKVNKGIPPEAADRN
jgi:PEGA domain-containing protein